MLDHLRRWNKWRKRNINGAFYHFLVLIGAVHSPTFSFTLTDQEEKKLHEAWKGVFNEHGRME